MYFPNIFTKEVSDKIIDRINKLKPAAKAQWGTMSVEQMLAHCNVTYEMVYDNNHPKPNFLMRFILRTFVKKIVTGNDPYTHNSRTAPAFIIKDKRSFETEKNRLVDYIYKTQQMGEASFDNKDSLSFGTLNKNEWNTMFYKHLDHHLTQFGV
ncbi:MAG: DUF1569 domain-containing protein [Ferruginibacter sp.]